MGNPMGTHVPVGYRWQNSGSGRCHPSISEQLHRRPRVAPEPHAKLPAHAGGALYPVKPSPRGRSASAVCSTSPAFPEPETLLELEDATPSSRLIPATLRDR